MAFGLVYMRTFNVPRQPRIPIKYFRSFPTLNLSLVKAGSLFLFISGMHLVHQLMLRELLNSNGYDDPPVGSTGLV